MHHKVAPPFLKSQARLTGTFSSTAASGQFSTMGTSTLVLVAIVAFATYCHGQYLKTGALTSANKVVCYYDSRSHLRQGQAKFDVNDLEPALEYCTHLIYGYAAINEDTFKLVPLNEQFDVIKDNYRKITDLKIKHPRLKVLLSVGGGADVSGDGSEKNLKYRTLLESSQSRLTFVNSAYTILKAFGFDGLDLAWEFPENKPKKIRSKLGSVWHSIKKTVGGTTLLDDKAEEHRTQFVSLLRELKNAVRTENMLVSLTVLPNVNSTVYYDPRAIAPNVDFVNLLAFDFYTPERNPKEADFPAPLYELVDRKPDENVDAQVKYWLNNGAPSNKIVLGIPTYGRAWKIDDESDLNGVPPLQVDGAAEPGPLSKDAGILAFPEICGKTHNQQKVPPAMQYKKVSDSSKRKGTFIFKLADENNNGGAWIGYDDLDVVMNKANYAKAKGLGGVAIKDLTLDDYRGVCGTSDTYDILRAARSQI